MKLMRLMNGKPQGFAGFGASARWSGVSARGYGHALVCTGDVAIATATAQRPLGLGGSTG